MTMDLTGQLIATGLLGVGSAYSRLTRDFRDAPLLAALTPSGTLYILVSVAISLSALGLLLSADWRFGLGTDVPEGWMDLLRVCVAGCGPPLVLHSSLISVKVGDLTIDPASFGNAILEQSRRGVHRSRAVRRLRRRKYLTGLVFAEHCVALAELVSGALQDPDPSHAEELGVQMGALSEREDLSDDLKLVLFQLALSNLAGERAVRKAAEQLRNMDSGRTCCLIRQSGRNGDVRCPMKMAAGEEAIEHIDLRETGEPGQGGPDPRHADPTPPGPTDPDRTPADPPRPDPPGPE